MEQIFVVDPYRNALHNFINTLNENAGAFGIPGGINLSNANLQPYTLRLHTQLKAGANSYDLDLKNANNQLSIEKRLVDGDIFQAYGMCMAIQKYDPTAPDFSTQLLTHPDPTYFPDIEAKCLELLYNGKTVFNTNSTNRIQDFDNHLFRYSPPGVFTGTLAAPVTNPGYGATLEQRGYYIFPSYPIIEGNKTNKIQVNLAQGATTNIGGTGADSNNLVILIHGFRYSGFNGGGSCQA